MLRWRFRYRHPDRTGLTIAQQSQADPRLSVSYARKSRVTVDGAGYVALAKRDNMQNPTIGGQFARLSMPSISSIGPYRQWCQRADAVGFPVGGMTMALVVRGEMLDVYSTTFVRGRPKHCVGSIELTSIAQMTATHGVTKTFVVILFNDGGVVEFEALSRSKAKRFVAALLAQRDAR